MEQKRNIWKLSAVLLVVGLLAGCGKTGQAEADSQTSHIEAVDYSELPQATHLASKESAEEVCGILQEAGASNVEIFREWVDDFTEVTGADANLAANWIAPDEMKADLAACMTGWEAVHDHSDSDCRMTALLLMEELLRAEKTEAGYNGTHLMFDVDAIENVERYKVLREKEDLFTTLFGEIECSDPMAAPGLFGKHWEDHGLTVDSEKVSLLSVVLYDEDFGELIVGHAGVLVDCGDHLLFVEKIAFEQPYQATRVKNIQELMGMLATRPEYDNGAGGTYLYRNGTLVDQLEITRSE